MALLSDTVSPADPNQYFSLEGDRLLLKDSWTLSVVQEVFPQLLKVLQQYERRFLRLDLSELRQLDSAGVVALQQIRNTLDERQIRVDVTPPPPPVAEMIKVFEVPFEKARGGEPEPSFLERIGGQLYLFWKSHVLDFFILLVDLIYYAVVDVFQKKAHRRGEFINQATLIGVNAVPIVGLVAFLIGVVLALQSGEQLRQFGANVFIVDLIVVAMVQEMGPLITAIMIAGRSGSAIAAEVATMVVTEEVDALKTMGFHPLRFIVVPKLHAALFTLPFLTIFADVWGILGGLLIAALSMNVSPRIFYNRMVDVLYLHDVVTGFVKSVTFAGLIVLVGSYFGFRVKGGAEGVGRVTTLAVVVSIILVILADSILGLIFY